MKNVPAEIPTWKQRAKGFMSVIAMQKQIRALQAEVNDLKEQREALGQIILQLTSDEPVDLGKVDLTDFLR